MASIAAGASVALTVAVGTYLEGTGAGSAVIGRAAVFQPLTAGDAWQIGPFTVATSVGITSVGAITYTVKDNMRDPSEADKLPLASVAAMQALVSPDGILAKVLGADTSIRSGYYHLAYRGAQAGNGLLLDQSGNNKDAANNTYVFPTGWTAGQTLAVGAYRAPTNPNAAAFVAGLPLFRVQSITTGVTAGTEPNPWPTIGGSDVVDGGVTWRAEKGPWYTDAGGVRQFRSLLDTQLGSTTAEVGGYNLGLLPWDMANGDSLILSVTSLQNYTSGPTNFNESTVAGNRTAGAAAAGLTLVATGQTTFNDLRLRISDGTTTRTAAHLDSGGVATNRPGDGSRRTTTYFLDGRTKRMYLCADGAPRNAANNYSGLSTTDLVAWDADISGVTGSTSGGIRPLMWGCQPNVDGSMNQNTFELGASRLDILVLPNRGLPTNIIDIAQWCHNRGEGLIPAGLVL